VPRDDDHRSVTLSRAAPGAFTLTNPAGGSISVGAAPTDFTPVELLLAALAGCAAVNIEELTSRRAVPDSFVITAEGYKARDDSGNHLEELRVLVEAVFPEGADGDAARAILPRVVDQTRDRICTVSRTVKRGTAVDYVVLDSSVED